MSTRWDPFRDVMSLREAMDRLLEESVVRPRGSGGSGRQGQTLPVDVWETSDSIQVRAPMPGAKPDAGDVDLTIDESMLTIRARLPGVANEEPEGKGSDTRGTGIRWITREVPRGEFTRTVQLPMAVDADKARAHFGDGLLVLTLPKAQVHKPRQIKVTTGVPSSQTDATPPQPSGTSPQSSGTAPRST